VAVAFALPVRALATSAHDYAVSVSVRGQERPADPPGEPCRNQPGNPIEHLQPECAIFSAAGWMEVGGDYIRNAPGADGFGGIAQNAENPLVDRMLRLANRVGDESPRRDR